MSVYFGSSTDEELISELTQRGFEVHQRSNSGAGPTTDTDLKNARAYEDTYSKGGFCDQVKELQSENEQLKAKMAELRRRVIVEKIEFYVRATGEILADTDWFYFVMNNEVYVDSGDTFESQCAVISFGDFIKRCPHIGWRVQVDKQSGNETRPE